MSDTCINLGSDRITSSIQLTNLSEENGNNRTISGDFC